MQIARMTEGEAFGLLHDLRWPDEVECPHCGGERPWVYGSRGVYKCRSLNCRRQFTLTSCTVFAGRKMPLQNYVVCAFMFASSGNGISSCSLARQIGVNQRTAFRLGHLFRRCLQAEQKGRVLGGHVEVDGCFVGGHREHENVVRDGRTYRITRGRFRNRSVVVIARERGGRSIGFVGKKESDAVDFLKAHISPNSIVYADQAHAWNSMKELYELLRINHKERFVDGETYTNNAESFFSRVRRLAMGVHGRISGPYLSLYVAEMIWRADRVRVTAEEKMREILSLVLRPVRTGST